MALPRLRKPDAHGAALITGSAFALSIALLLTGDETGPSDLVPSTGVVSYALVLGAAVLTYFHWRMVSVTSETRMPARLAGWLTVGLTAGAANGLLQLVPLDDGRGAGAYLWSMISQLALLLLLCVVASIAERVDLPADPALVGVVTAVAVIGAHAVALQLAPTLVPSGTSAALLNASVLLASLLLAWIVLHRSAVSLWARRRLAASAVLLTAAQCAINVDHSRATLMAGAIAAYLLGAVTLWTMTQQLLRSSMLEHQAEMERLHRSLAEVRSEALGERELLHEVGATLAGITNASYVMRQGHGVPAHRRQRLESMLAAELGRLERLMHARATGADQAADGGADCEMDMDEVVQHLVVSHRARGRDIEWAPCGRRAVGDPDELAELLHILLENAARHGGGVIRLSVDATDDGVVAVCSDDGPGVAPELRDRLFESEVRRPGSLGQGLGLGIAHRLVTARGGTLELVDDGRRGATFVARLPQKGMTDVAAGHVA